MTGHAWVVVLPGFPAALRGTVVLGAGSFVTPPVGLYDVGEGDFVRIQLVKIPEKGSKLNT